MAVADVARIEERLDRTVAASTEVTDIAGGVLFRSMAEVMEFAKLMSLADVAVPKHLRANPGACLRIVTQAIEWRMSPFAVADKSYLVNDRVAYESQLIHAVIEARAPLVGRLRPEYSGEGQERSCKIVGKIKGETEALVVETPKLKDIKPQNSPLWKNDPDQQLWYYGSRVWCRRYCPDVLLGIYDRDELGDNVGFDRAKDVTPKPSIGDRLPGPGKKGRGFDAAHVDRETARDEEHPAEEQSVGENDPETEAAPSEQLELTEPPQDAGRNKGGPDEVEQDRKDTNTQPKGEGESLPPTQENSKSALTSKDGPDGSASGEPSDASKGFFGADADMIRNLLNALLSAADPKETFDTFMANAGNPRGRKGEALKQVSELHARFYEDEITRDDLTAKVEGIIAGGGE